MVRMGLASLLGTEPDIEVAGEAENGETAGGRAISPEIMHFMEEDPPVRALTRRQSEILDAVVRGFANDDIAKMFSIQRSSVKDHLTAIFAKLGASNRSEAIAIAFRKHLL